MYQYQYYESVTVDGKQISCENNEWESESLGDYDTYKEKWQALASQNPDKVKINEDVDERGNHKLSLEDRSGDGQVNLGIEYTYVS